MIDLHTLGKFSELGEIFDISVLLEDNPSFELNEGDFVNILPHFDNFISISKVTSNENLTTEFLSGKIDNKADKIIKNLIAKDGKTFNVFYQITKSYKNHLEICAFKSKNIILDKSGSDIYIGVDNSDEIKNSFTFTYNKHSYVVSLSFEEIPNFFYLIGTRGNEIVYLNVQSKKIATLLSELPEGISSDDEVRIGEIENDPNINKGTIRLGIRRNQYTFVNKIDALPVKNSALYAENYELHNPYLKSWETFSKFEEKLTYEYIEDIGSVDVINSYFDGNILNVVVKNPEKWIEMKKKAIDHNLQESFAVGYNFSFKNRETSEMVFSSREVSVSILNFNDKSSTVRCLIEKIPNGFDANSISSLYASKHLSEVMFNRRNIAFRNIASGKTGISNFASYFNGENPSSMLDTKKYPFTNRARNLVFKGNAPTIDQEEAIKIALNTPDFAIIQGPPGTGKTKVISAISASIPKPEKSEDIDLYTAYQNVATSHLADTQQDCFDFPFDTLTSKKAKVDKESRALNWANEKAEELRKKNINACDYIQGIKEKRVFYNIKTHYNWKTATIGNDANLLYRLKNECLSIYKNNLYEIDRLYSKTKKFLPNKNYDTSTLFSFLYSLPQNKIAFTDGGISNVKDLLLKFKIFAENNESDKDKIDEIVNKIIEAYQETSIDFDSIYKLKIELSSYFINIDPTIINRDLNFEIKTLLQKIDENMSEENVSDKDYIIANYILDLEGSSSSVYKTMKKFQDRLIATHQMSGSDEAASISSFYRNVFADEAARSNPADLLISLSKAKEKIILVGDQNQLPQYIDDEVYKLIDEETLSGENKLLIKQTLFEYLINAAHKLESKDGIRRVIRLKTQFRMPRVLGNFIGDEFYSKDENGNLLPEQERGLSFGGKDEDHFHKLPGLENKAMVFVDVKQRNKAVKVGHSYKNEDEANSITEFLEKCCNDFSCKSLTFGIVSFYKAQIECIKNKLVEKQLIQLDEEGNIDYLNSLLKVEIKTVDSYQGEEKDVILLSLVKGNEDMYSFSSYAFLNDSNRLNVALSRAKKCCILFADPNLFKGENCKTQLKPLLHFFSKCDKEEEGCIRVK